ncbi:MAG: hypothetical protein AAFN74_23105, partial [Myxococcota bacterium]
MPLVLLAACVHTPSAAPSQSRIQQHPFGPRPVLPSPQDVHRLSPKQVEDFLAFFRNPQRSEEPPHVRVAKYLTAMTGSFDYQGYTTDARTTLEDKVGNCMALAVLTTALSDLAGVEVSYELVDGAPVFELYGTVIYRGMHVRTVLRSPTWTPPRGQRFLIKPSVRIDYFADVNDRFVKDISRREYVALYYANLAAESVRGGRLDTAYWLLRASLAQDPKSAAAW